MKFVINKTRLRKYKGTWTVDIPRIYTHLYGVLSVSSDIPHSVVKKFLSELENLHEGVIEECNAKAEALLNKYNLEISMGEVGKHEI